MIRQTGGFAWGATSTRSRSSSRALRTASWVATTPICSPSAPTRRTWGDRILSFKRGSVETPHHSLRKRSTGPAGACGGSVGTRGQEYRGSDGCRRCSPVGFERATVSILEALGVVLGRVAVGDLEDPAGARTVAADPMSLFRRDHEL